MRALTFVAAAVLAVAGCRDSAGPRSSFVGTYVLTSYDGQALPATVAHGGSATRTYSSGSIVIRPNGTYELTLNYSELRSGISTLFNDFAEGRFTRDGSFLVLEYGDGRAVAEMDGRNRMRVLVLDGATRLVFDRGT